MGMNADRRATIGEFERGHLQRSFKMSLVALPVALATSLLGFSGLWIVGAYGGAFWLGWRVGGRVQRGEARRAEGFVVRFFAWDDARPVLVLLVVLLPAPLLLVWIDAFWLSLEGMEPESLSADEVLGLLGAAYEAVSGWDTPWSPLLALAAVSLGVVSGLNDGLWVGSVQSRTGARFGQTIPFGRDWTEWREERRERRQAYLGGGG